MNDNDKILEEYTRFLETNNGEYDYLFRRNDDELLIDFWRHNYE